MYVKESQKLFDKLERLVHISLDETFSCQTICKVEFIQSLVGFIPYQICL